MDFGDVWGLVLTCFGFSIVNYGVSRGAVWPLTAGKVKTRNQEKYFKAKI